MDYVLGSIGFCGDQWLVRISRKYWSAVFPYFFAGGAGANFVCE